MRTLSIVGAGLAAAGLVGPPVATLAAQDILLEKTSGTPAQAPIDRTRPKDHYTPYLPPSSAELPANAKVHIIQKGDTLWDLARAYLGDPYFWPQLWEVNAYITDPHWIFPGDPLVIPVPLLISEVVSEELPFEVLPPPHPVAKRYDVYCASYIRELDPDFKLKKRRGRRGASSREVASLESPAGEAEAASASLEQPKRRRGLAKPRKAQAPVILPPQIIATELGRVALADGDVLYINRGEKDGVVAGDEFLVSEELDLVIHPVTREPIGTAMQMVGTIRVICTQQSTSTAVVVSACEDMNAGALIRPLEPIPIPLAGEYQPTPAQCSDLGDKVSGHIVHAKRSKAAFAEEDLVSIDLGSDAGIVPGDFVTIFRDSDIDPAFPPSVLGDAVVLLVEKSSATVKVMSSYIDMHLGDRVRLK